MGDKKQIDWPIERLIKVHQQRLKTTKNTERVLREKLKNTEKKRKNNMEWARGYRNQWWESMREVDKLKEEIKELQIENQFLEDCIYCCG